MKRIYALMALLIGLTYSSQAQTYCTTSLYTTGCTVGDDLDDVTLNNLVQTNTGCSTNGYADYTADTILVQQTAFLNISVTSNYSSQWYAIWIDANDDGDFDDAGEQIWASTAASGTAGTTTADAFVIPSTVPIGNHRLRMRGKFAGSALASTESCSSFTYGETHDYTVLVAGPPACPQPYALIAGSATATNFTFSFTSTGSSFDLEYGPAGFTQGTG
ncbi:MAG: GEVED domain-containing protein, partial [Schleiferiaceae bacterium]|nr:GEVED domain-containing protein [Schleiferiaceae bacterium]